jgi:type II secretory pathway pseudopilin PulG
MTETNTNRINIPITMSGEGLDDAAARNIASLQRLRSSLQSTAQSSRESGKTIGQLQDEYDQARGQSERLAEKLTGLKEAYEKADPSAEGYAEAQYKAARAIAACESQISRLDEQMAQNKAAQYGKDADEMRQKITELAKQTDIETAALRAQGDESGAAALAMQRQGDISRLLAQYQKSLSDALDKATRECGDNSREVEILSGKYNNASDALVKMTGKMRDVGSAAEDSAGDVKESMTDILSSIRNAAQDNSLKDLGQSLTNTLTDPIVDFGKTALEAGLAAESMEDSFDTAYRQSATNMRRWSQSFSEALNVNEYAVRETMTGYKAVFNGLALDGDKANSMVVDLTSRAYDLAAMFDTDVATATEKLQSGLLGSSETLRGFGVVINEATVKAYAYKNGIAKTGKELTEQEKVLARYGLIMDQTSQVSGRWTQENDTASGKIKVLNEKIEELKVELGKALIPVAERVLDVVTPIVSKIADLPDWAFNMIVGIGGLVAVLGPLLSLLGTLSQIKMAAQITGIIGAGSSLSGLLTVSILPTLGKVLLILLAVAAAIALIKWMFTGTSTAADQKLKQVSSQASQAQKQVSGVKRNARGSSYYSGGETWVGEEGPERVELPQGSRIYPADESQRRGGGDTWYLLVDMDRVSDVNKLTQTARDARRMARMGVPQKA